MGNLSAWFGVPWRFVPAQAVLFVFVWIAGVHVIATPNNEQIGFLEAGLSSRVYIAWNILILVSPCLVAISYMLIRYSRGHFRVAGFWVRLGGDFGVMSALSALIWTRIAVLTATPDDRVGDSPLFSLISLSGVTVFTAMLIVRDIGAIVLLERLATRLEKERNAE